jgi:antirestriction protein ArdC
MNLGITTEVRDDHASYIANWLTVLKNDKRAIFSAAAHVQKAVDYLHGVRAESDTQLPDANRRSDPVNKGC